MDFKNMKRVTRSPELYVLKESANRWVLMNATGKTIGVFPIEAMAVDSAIESAKTFLKIPKAQNESMKQRLQQFETIGREMGIRQLRK